MLNRDRNKNSKKKIIGLIRKKNSFSLAAHFFVHFFAVVLHNYNIELPGYTFYRGNVVCLYVFQFTVFFHCRSFSPWWPLAFLIFSPPLLHCHVFLLTKFVSFAFYLLLLLFLCYPHQCGRKD